MFNAFKGKNMRILKLAGILSVLSIAGIVNSHAAEGLICPVPQVSAEQIEAVNKILPDYEDFRDRAKIAGAIETMKNDGDDLIKIVNSLIGAYCPLVEKQQGLSLAQQTNEVRHLGLTVTREAFSLSSENSVIVDVELPQAVFEKVQEQSKAKGVLPAEWIENNIEKLIAE